MTSDPFELERLRMVEDQLRARGIGDARVLDAFARVPRHLFVPEEERGEAYADYPLPIGEGQTISQPFIVALMIRHMNLRGGERVLEIGTGSGYQTALLAELGCEVFTVERIAALQERAKSLLASLGYARIRYRVGDGTLGWPEEAPFDHITVGAAAPEPPPSLVAQIAEGGSMIIPIGGVSGQDLTLIERRGGETSASSLGGCVFVRLIGKEGW